MEREPKFINTNVQKLEGPKILDKSEIDFNLHRASNQPCERKHLRCRISGKPTITANSFWVSDSTISSADLNYGITNTDSKNSIYSLNN